VLNLKIFNIFFFNRTKKLKKKSDKSKSNRINIDILYFLVNFFKLEIKLIFFKFFKLTLKEFKKVYKSFVSKFSQFKAIISLDLKYDVIK
jgi:hypothetical protein